MSKPYDIAVAWRIYPGVSKKPLIFPTDKFSLVKICLKSFLQSTKGLKVRFYFILDGCPVEYTQLIKDLFNEKTITIINTSGIGNWATFRKQVEILCTQDDADSVYFAEDDYLYRPGEFHKMFYLLNNEKNVDFVSCYEHMDIFTHPIHQHKKKELYAYNQQWHTDSSTCLTFLTTRKTLLATKNVFLTYSKGNNDCAIWLVLTKTFILNPVAYLKFFVISRESFNILKMAVKYSFSYFFFFRRYQLWVPHPAIGTHLEKDLVSPGIDWIELSKEIEPI